jgi:hypothetical protein
MADPDDGAAAGPQSGGQRVDAPDDPLEVVLGRPAKQAALHIDD